MTHYNLFPLLGIYIHSVEYSVNTQLIKSIYVSVSLSLNMGARLQNADVDPGSLFVLFVDRVFSQHITASLQCDLEVMFTVEVKIILDTTFKK